MLQGDTCARNTQEIANLFGEYFQGVYSVYVRDDSQADFVVDDGVEDSSTVMLIWTAQTSAVEPPFTPDKIYHSQDPPRPALRQ
jgi:hypothetical protein